MIGVTVTLLHVRTVEKGGTAGCSLIYLELKATSKNTDCLASRSSRTNKARSKRKRKRQVARMKNADIHLSTRRVGGSEHHVEIIGIANGEMTKVISIRL